MKKLYTLISISLLSLASRGYAQNAALAQGQQAFARKDYAESARLFYGALVTGQGPDRAKAQIALAESLRNLNLDYSAAYFYARTVAEGPQNPFFRIAFESLGQLNNESPLGRASVAGLFEKKIDPLTVPPDARGFFFFYRGVEYFERKNQAAAKAEFERVPSSSPYYAKAQYYLGTILSLNKDLDGALNAYAKGERATTKKSDMNTLMILSQARVYYEKKEYRKTFQFYSRVPRNSDLWLQSIFEGSWSFFMLQKHNNTLGNSHTLHSPFFNNRFYPESYILNAITYLRLCRYNNVKDELKKFQNRYKPTFSDLTNLLNKYQNNGTQFYSLISRYNSQRDLREYPGAAEIIDQLSRTDAFKESKEIVSHIEKERPAISRYGSKWEASGLGEILRQSLEERRKVSVQTAGADLFKQARELLIYLKDLSDQTRLINLEMLSGRTDQLRNKLVTEAVGSDGTQWGDGMKPLNLKQAIEYWPFEGEYWEDELGGYVYNIDSKCTTAAKPGKGK